jgi:hypothetical protein
LSDLPRADLVCPTSTAALLRAEARVDADADARMCNALFFSSSNSLPMIGKAPFGAGLHVGPLDLLLCHN